MEQFNIEALNNRLKLRIQERIDDLTKPKGSLGRLEELALQISLIQETISPIVTHPCHLLFAADHGIVEEQISLSPKEITFQAFMNMTKGMQAINFLVRQHNFDLVLVDAGIDAELPYNTNIYHFKIRRGTRNYRYESAMTEAEMNTAISTGAGLVERLSKERGADLFSFGEMGITNTSSAAMWMTTLTGIPLNECVGGGSDHTGGIIPHKLEVLSSALANYKGDHSPKSLMQYFGGYEMVMTVGGMLKAAEMRKIILIDGFIMTACALMAATLYPVAKEYFIFGHKSDEHGHSRLLEHMNASPILDLGMRLGEGTGAICAYPIIESAMRMMREMRSFKDQKITKYFS